MSDAEKVAMLADALRRVNQIIFAKTLTVGSSDYFDARNLICGTLKAVGEKIT